MYPDISLEELSFSEHGYGELQRIGKGKEGTVFRAKYQGAKPHGNLMPGQAVAIKLTAAARVRPNEVLVQSRLAHRCIARVFDVFRITDLCGHDHVATVLELSDPGAISRCVTDTVSACGMGPGSTLWTCIRNQVERNMLALFTKRRTKAVCPVWCITRPVPSREGSKGAERESPDSIAQAEPDLRWIFLQVATALDYLHRHPLAICNRDVKLENMLVTGFDSDHCDGRPRVTVKLADFGFCKAHSSPSRCQERTKLGTSYYVAPEVFGFIPDSGDGYSGSRADVWSAGIALYTLATGLRPFHDKPRDSAWTIMQRAANQADVDRLFEHLAVNGASDGLQDLLRRMIVINPAARISMFDVLQHAWSRRLNQDFRVIGPTGQPMYAPVWHSMWSCVQQDHREACTAFANPSAAHGHFVDFGWSMPHLNYASVAKMLKEVRAIGHRFDDSSDGESEGSDCEPPTPALAHRDG